jgi:osmotically inducible protein OsmC
MATEKTARATWEGDLAHGSGHVTTGSGSVDTDMSWSARAEDAEGASPEELIAAAHAACFSMALSNGLAQAGHAPEQLETSATVAFQPPEGITKIALTVQGSVPGMSEDDFRAAAEQAKENCPVSKALASVPSITVEANLS